MSGQDRIRTAIGEASAAADKAARVAIVSTLMELKEARTALVVAMAEDPDETGALLARLGAVRGMDRTVSAMRTRLKTLAGMHNKRARLRLAEQGEESGPLKLDHLPPINVPQRYEIGDGIHERRETPEGIDLVRLTHRVILPSLILADIDTGERSVQLEWQERKGWGSRIVKSSDIQDPRSFVAMRDAGAPVAAHNSRGLARFIDEIEEYNTDTIPRAWATRRMGWMRGGDLGFALGGEVIGSEQVRVELDPDGSEAQIAEALKASGSEREWLDAVGSVAEYPSVMLALYASICAPLLGVLPSAPNAIFGWCGETSTGKTTILRLAASVWGDPDERGVGLVQKWNQTPVYLERLAAFCTSLPVCLDDTNDVADRQKDMIPRMLYQFAGGKGRGRGKPDGTRRTESWRSPMLSTGEASLTSYSQDAGARARTLVLMGPPFGAGSQEALVADVTMACLDNYGHMGPRLVRQLLEHRGDWSAMGERYDSRCADYAAAADRTATKRLGKVVALLEEAKRLGESCGLPVPTCDPIEYAWDAAQTCGEDTDRPLAALRSVYGWAVAHSAEFWGRHIKDKDETPRQPSRGWAGRWDAEEWDRISFLPDCLDRILQHHGFDPGAVIPLWLEREWLVTTGGRKTSKTRIDRDNVRCVAIKSQAIMGAM